MNDPGTSGSTGTRRWDDVLVRKILLACGDMLSVAMAFYFSYIIRNYFFAWRGGVYVAGYKHTIFLAGLLILVFLHFRTRALYRQLGFSTSIAHLETMTRAWIGFVAFFVVLSFFFRLRLFIEHRITVALFTVSGWVFLYIFRFQIVPRISRWILHDPQVGIHAVIVGAGAEGRRLARELVLRKNSFRVVGFVDDDPQPTDPSLPILGTTEQLPQIVREHHVEEVFINMPKADSAKLTQMLTALEPYRVRVRVALSHFGILNQKIAFLPDVEEGILFINNSPLIRFDRLIKRSMDLAGSILGLVVTSPLFLLSALLIKLGSPGPVFFRQRRVGKDGRAFSVYKFRSMRENTEEHHRAAVGALMQNNVGFFEESHGNQALLKAVDPAQVTRVGRVLRRYSLDELPQLINVAKGEMSLVGPRPEPEYQVALYKPWHRERHHVKPGITGFWQVFGRSTVSHDDMVLMDIFYINNWSIALDLRILARTFFVVLTGKGGL